MHEDIEWSNAYWARQHDLAKDTPGKRWFYAEAMHPAIFRALKIDRTESGAIYAAAPFRLYRDEDGARVLIASPCPPLFDERGDDWLAIEHVIEWWPHHNRVSVMDDPGAKLVGRIDETQCQIFGDAFAFARQLAEARAQWFVSWCMSDGDWRRKPTEPDLTPGLLAIGDPAKVAWPSRDMPEDVTCIGIDPVAINRAMLRQARIPRARAQNTYRAAA